MTSGSLSLPLSQPTHQTQTFSSQIYENKFTCYVFLQSKKVQPGFSLLTSIGVKYRFNLSLWDGTQVFHPKEKQGTFTTRKGEVPQNQRSFSKRIIVLHNWKGLKKLLGYQMRKHKEAPDMFHLVLTCSIH